MADEELINEIGYAFYARCETIWVVTERRCPKCTGYMTWNKRKTPSTCPQCGWTATWAQYHASYKGKRIHGGRAFGAFVQYMKEFRRAQSAREKLFAIDKLIHSVHENCRKTWTLPAAVNLIEGKYDEILQLLDDLAIGDCSSEQRRKNWVEYRSKIEESQGTKNYLKKKQPA